MEIAIRAAFDGELRGSQGRACEKVKQKLRESTNDRLAILSYWGSVVPKTHALEAQYIPRANRMSTSLKMSGHMDAFSAAGGSTP
jgi:hypothetical protein